MVSARTLDRFYKWCTLNPIPVFLPIQMRDGDDFSAHVVVESVERVGVDEAVADPQARLHDLFDLSHHLLANNKKKFKYALLEYYDIWGPFSVRDRSDTQRTKFVLTKSEESFLSLILEYGSFQQNEKQCLQLSSLTILTLLLM